MLVNFWTSFGPQNGPVLGPEMPTLIGPSYFFHSSSPKRPQDGPRLLQDGLRWPKMAQDGPKMAPRWLKAGPRWPKMVQAGRKMAPRWPKMTQDGSKMAPRWKTRAQEYLPNKSRQRIRNERKREFTSAQVDDRFGFRICLFASSLLVVTWKIV